jgi:hypothetical protein
MESSTRRATEPAPAPGPLFVKFNALVIVGKVHDP